MRVINYIWTRTSTRNWLSHTPAVKRGCFAFEFDWFTFHLVCTKSNNSFYHFDINFIDRYILYFFNGSVFLIKPNKFLIASDFAFSYCSVIVNDNVLQSTCIGVGTGVAGGSLPPTTLNIRGASNIFGPTTFTKCIKFIFHLRNNSFKYFYHINMSQNSQLFQIATFGR